MLSFSNEAVGYLVGSVKDSGCRPVMPSMTCTGTNLTRTTEYMYVFPKSVRIFIRVIAHLNSLSNTVLAHVRKQSRLLLLLLGSFTYSLPVYKCKSSCFRICKGIRYSLVFSRFLVA